MKQDMRAAFESVLTKLFGTNIHHKSQILRKVQYFDVWQAAIAHAVPEGCVVVPKEPTLLMMHSALNFSRANGGPLTVTQEYSEATSIYRAMIAAAQEGDK
jgi:hypothetical protein